MVSLRCRYSSTAESAFSFQHALDGQSFEAGNEITDMGGSTDACGGPSQHNPGTGTNFAGVRNRPVAAVAPEVARMPSLDSNPQLKAAVSHAEHQRTGLDSQTGLQCSWLDIFFHIPGTGLQGAQPFVKMEAIIAPAAVGSCRRQQTVDWVRLGLAKTPFVEQLVAPMAAWAWDGSHRALDMRRFNFGPEQGSLVWFDAALSGGGRAAVVVDLFRKTDGGEGPPTDLASAMMQVSEGGKAAVRATVRLSVSVSTLVGGGGGGGKHRRQGSGGTGGPMSPHTKASTASGSCRPIFTVASVYISGLAPAKMKEPTFAPGPLLHGNIECAAIAAVGGARATKPVAFGGHVPRGGSGRIGFATPLTSRLEPSAGVKAARPRGFGSSAATHR